MKKQKGITLIALIVSIIVMLILAGVTIQILTQGEIINRAAKATDDTKSAIENEQAEANEAAYNIENALANPESEFEVAPGKPHIISNYIGTSTEIFIPAKIGGVKITEIGASAFSENTNITKVVLPSTITDIGLSAFQNCSSLEDVFIPSSLQYIDDTSFSGTPFLENLLDEGNGVAISNTILLKVDDLNYTISSNYLSDGIFTVPSKITLIARSAFSACDFTGVILNNNLKYINEFAFNTCYYLTSITIPSSVVSINYGAFQQCVALATINIAQTTDSISGSPWGAPHSSLTVNWNYSE
jgi:type II secretory pathway pseudopilin PulG